MHRENDYSSKTGSTKKQEFCEPLKRMKCPSLWTYTSELVLLQGFLSICKGVSPPPKAFLHESGVMALVSIWSLFMLKCSMLDAFLTTCHHSWKLFGGFRSGWEIDIKTDTSTSPFYKPCFVINQAKDDCVKETVFTL